MHNFTIRVEIREPGRDGPVMERTYLFEEDSPLTQTVVTRCGIKVAADVHEAIVKRLKPHVVPTPGKEPVV
jgi:hypothetical protein